ncbi:MAG: Ni/Fe hydrogenase subunit gamma [Kangiellaceae bacterium]|jgi:NAD(P)H-flavin reductase|nr:Ni/Fe hydrogenase subunit gamma [Kangiellaceae bacterium]|tara:strand:+ start:16083 stop:16919 length:837 start_codon:yes stop_codon:yes gene_type:complete
MTTNNCYIPHEVEIVERVQETPDVYTFKIKFTDPEIAKSYTFKHGQFNMLYLYGVGEVPISIMSNDGELLVHTIRAVGRVTNAMMGLQVGDKMGLRGPFGRGWPLDEAKGKDIVFVTAGLGCAPVVSSIRYVIGKREEYGKLVIMQSVKHRHDVLWEPQYDEWRRVPNTQILLAASREKTQWPQWELGRVAVLFDKADYDKDNCVVMVCGPDAMMSGTARTLIDLNVDPKNIYLSMERNMQCAVGHCGHCQFGSQFVCKDGPVFSYPEVEELLRHRGF